MNKKPLRIRYNVGAVLGGGGFGNTAAHSLSGLLRDGAEVFVTATGLRTSAIPQDRVRIIEGADAFAKRYSSLPLLWKIPNLYSMLRDNYFDFLAGRELEQVDTVHSWGNFALRLFRRAKQKGYHTAVDRASCHIQAQRELQARAAKKWNIPWDAIHPIELWKSDREFDLADLIFVPSEFKYETYLHYGVDERKLALLPFGVECARYAHLRSVADPFLVCFVGGIGVPKGVPELIEAWKKLSLKNARLRITGPGDRKSLEMLRRLAPPESVEIQGPRSTPEELFGHASLFAFPSINEGSALVTYEAMASGLPVITTREAGSVLRDGVDGFLIPSLNPDALAERIRYFYDHREQLAIMGEAARSWVQRYTWESYGDRVAAAHRMLVEGQSVGKKLQTPEVAIPFRVS